MMQEKTARLTNAPRNKNFAEVFPIQFQPGRKTPDWKIDAAIGQINTRNMVVAPRWAGIAANSEDANRRNTAQIANQQGFAMPSGRAAIKSCQSPNRKRRLVVVTQNVPRFGKWQLSRCKVKNVNVRNGGALLPPEVGRKAGTEPSDSWSLAKCAITCANPRSNYAASHLRNLTCPAWQTGLAELLLLQ